MQSSWVSQGWGESGFEVRVGGPGSAGGGGRCSVTVCVRAQPRETASTFLCNRWADQHAWAWDNSALIIVADKQAL